MAVSIERSFRGISPRLAKRYLESLGGETVDADTVDGDGWTAMIVKSTVTVGPTLNLTELTITFSGDEEQVETVVESFAQKAMRAGG